MQCVKLNRPGPITSADSRLAHMWPLKWRGSLPPAEKKLLCWFFLTPGLRMPSVLLPEFNQDARLLNVIAKEMSLRAGIKDFDIPISELRNSRGDAQLIFFLNRLKKAGLINEQIQEELALAIR